MVNTKVCNRDKEKIKEKMTERDTVLCKQVRRKSLTFLYDPCPMIVIGIKRYMIGTTWI